MLAGKKTSMKQYYEYKKKKEEEEDDTRMFEEGDEETIPIPNSFRQLADHHFPLFVTYKKFSKMLMKTYGINSQNLNIHQSDKNNIDDERLLEIHKMFVTNKFVPLSTVKYTQ